MHIYETGNSVLLIKHAYNKRNVRYIVKYITYYVGNVIITNSFICNAKTRHRIIVTVALSFALHCIHLFPFPLFIGHYYHSNSTCTSSITHEYAIHTLIYTHYMSQFYDCICLSTRSISPVKMVIMRRDNCMIFAYILINACITLYNGSKWELGRTRDPFLIKILFHT